MNEFYGRPPWKVVEGFHENANKVFVVDASGQCVCFYDLREYSKDQIYKKCEALVRRFNEAAGRVFASN
jgi:hypothetical protein